MHMTELIMPAATTVHRSLNYWHLQVLIRAATAEAVEEEGDICEFYNQEFVPIMLKYSDSTVPLATQSQIER